ncbi:MAG: ABC transporter ATP-binding protein [Phototrophicaceae bacterium]
MPLHADVAATETNFNVKETISHQRLKGLWQLLQGYRRRYIGAIVMLGISAIANTASLLLLRYIVDTLLNPDAAPVNFTTLIAFTALAFVGLAAIQGVFAFFSGAWAAETGEGIALRVRDYMFDHLQHLSFTYHDKMQTGELIQRSTSDIFAIQQFFSGQAIGIGRIVLLFVVNFSALLWLNVPLAIISVLVVPLVIVMSLYFFKLVGDAYERFQEQDEKVSTALQENLSGVRVVKAFARQDYEIDRFEEENHKKYELGLAFMRLHALYWPITDVLTGYQMLAGFVLGALLVMTGDGNVFATIGPVTLTGISLGTFISYMALIGWIINPLRNLGRLIVQMTTGLVSYNRLVEVFEEDWEDLGLGQTAPVTDIKGNMAFNNLNFTYRDGPQVLHDISFTVEAGQTIALLGSTGSGKTSLMALLTRFYDAPEGSITLEGVDLNQYPKYFLRETIGVVEQESFLFSTTIRENITYGVHREVSDEEVFAASRAAAVHEVILEFPEGYDTKVGERGVTLSGGQKQRVALARTLLKNPKILILDDSTSSVDTETESQIREALNKMMANRTSFIIAHRIQSVMDADLILVMDKGRIIERGTHEELMVAGGTYRRTYDMQAQIESDLEKEIASVGA